MHPSLFFGKTSHNHFPASAPLAQRLEQRPHKALVKSSNLLRGTILYKPKPISLAFET